MQDWRGGFWEGHRRGTRDENEKMWKKNQKNLTHIPHSIALLAFLRALLPLLPLSPSCYDHVASVSGCGQPVSSMPAGFADLSMTTQREESPSQNSKLDHSRINPLLCLLLLLFLLRNIWVVVCPLDNIWRNWQWKSWRRPGLPRLWSIALNVSVCNFFSFFLLLRPREKYFNDVQHFQLNDSQRWDWYCWWLPDKVKTLTSQRKKKKGQGVKQRISWIQHWP